MRMPSKAAFRVILRAGLPIVVGLLGAWIGMRAFGGDTVEMGPFQVRMTSGFGSGETIVELPPLGELRADTHDTPLTLRAALTDVDVLRLSEELKGRSTREIVDSVEADARDRLRPYAARVAAVAVAGSLALGVLVFRRRWRATIAATATALVVVVGSQVGAWTTYRQAAFAEPHFSGTLALAPQLVGPVAEIEERIDAFRANLERIVGGAIRAYTALEPTVVTGGDEIRVLHISDVHLNTIGLDFAVGLARGFDVSFVVDTGDLTSYGTPVEELIAQQLVRFGRPYLFVPGNHDSPGVQEALQAVPNVRVLDGEVAMVDGVTVYGLGHPVFTEDQEQDVDHPEFVERARDASRRIVRDLRATAVVPDIVAVHDARMVEELAGRFPLAISGHFHRPQAATREGTLYLRAGTTGGSGVNMFEDGSEIPLSATILYFRRAGPPELVAYDLIQQSPVTGRLTVQRHRVGDVPEPTSTASPETPASPSPAP